ncbi:putative toxin-antitoxin system toxin component, PIN family [Roseateles violae]|uniref:Toxin-antitoxin system toxin component, PIN family n=1 Tax=Roseateles violae TaxID=3058042 RepID=A0ABT8E0B6_9BURK|nr:putative toxin-antitoxin system toxin component, PIN family [Pelomonas sp. PFR6]MDN3923291.1 putative toxin-antitoxin system toxin component, PIN family [Pelomonas sp. PFR6]
MPTETAPPAAAPPALAVIDTQVVMDWLVFGDARVAPLVRALEEGALHWIGRPAMLDELRHVLGRGVAAAYAPDLARIEAAFARHCRMVEAAPAPAVRLVCRDPDDQQFIDLAIAERARWLISRDRAVLALAKRARALDLAILTPEAWLKQQA